MATTSQTAEPRAITHPRRKDAWWVMPLFTVVVLGGFGVYATFRAFEGFWSPELAGFENYLSPFYSPPIAEWLGIQHLVPTAILILAFPLTFRLTCYYYRKAYYRAFFWDPPACALPERRKKYKGETAFPFVLVNIHRITFFFAAIFVAFLWYDTFQAFIFDGRFGIGLGSILFLVNIVLLSVYTFSCHSFRHLIGGKLDCFSCPKAQIRYKLWNRVSIWNRNHMLWAWLSLFSVAIVDIYVRFLAAGIITDVRFF